jgi:transposase-like protein
MSRSKFKTPIIDAILEQLRMGATYQIACAKVGIGEKTLYRWLARGREQTRGQYRDFVEAVSMANAEGAGAALRCIQTESLTNWKCAAWLLERRYNYRRDSKIHEQMTIEQTANDDKPLTPREIVWGQLCELKESMTNARNSGSWQAYAALQRAYMSSYREYREICEQSGNYDQFDEMTDEQLINHAADLLLSLPAVIREQVNAKYENINSSVIEFKK